MDVLIHLVKRCEWMRGKAKNQRNFTATSVIIDSETIRLTPPDDEITAKLLSVESPSPDAHVFLGIRIANSSMAYRKGSRRFPDKYRLTVPSEQRQWLQLVSNEGEVCVIFIEDALEIWSMNRARNDVPHIGALL